MVKKNYTFDASMSLNDYVDERSCFANGVKLQGMKFKFSNF